MPKYGSVQNALFIDKKLIADEEMERLLINRCNTRGFVPFLFEYEDIKNPDRYVIHTYDRELGKFKATYKGSISFVLRSMSVRDEVDIQNTLGWVSDVSNPFLQMEQRLVTQEKPFFDILDEVCTLSGKERRGWGKEGW